MGKKWTPEQKAQHKERMKAWAEQRSQGTAPVAVMEEPKPTTKPINLLDADLDAFMAERADGSFKPKNGVKVVTIADTKYDPVIAAPNAKIELNPEKKTQINIIVPKPDVKALDQLAKAVKAGAEVEWAEQLARDNTPEALAQRADKFYSKPKRTKSYEEGLELGYSEGLQAGYEKGTRAINTALAALPQYQQEWEGRDLQILMPLHLQTNGATLYMLMAFALDIGMKGLRFDIEMGDAMIYHARNKLANRFMNTGANWSFWLDSDIVAPFGRAGLMRKICSIPQAVGDDVLGLYAPHRLIGHGKTIVGGTYFGRQKSGPPMFGEALHDMQANREARGMIDRIRETAWVATGCLMVNRKVYLDIQNKFPELAPQGQREEWDFFRPGEVDGEDVAFCKRAKEAGHTVYVDTGLQCFHVGYCAWGVHNTQNVVKSSNGLFD